MDFNIIPVGYLVLVFVAAGARFMLAKEPPTIKLLLATCLWGLFVVLAGYDWVSAWATDKTTGVVNKGLVTALVAAGSFLAKDILQGLIKLLEQVSNDPLSFLRDWLNKRSPPPN